MTIHRDGPQAINAELTPRTFTLKYGADVCIITVSNNGIDLGDGLSSNSWRINVTDPDVEGGGLTELRDMVDEALAEANARGLTT